MSSSTATPANRSGAPWSRRRFLGCGAAGLALAGNAHWLAGPVRTRAAEPPPSERVTVGLIGCGLMGSGHLRRLAGDPGFQLVAVCDVDATRRDKARAAVEAHYAGQRGQGTWKGCQATGDFREILAREDVDAVLIATPDHWHAAISIAAARHGKDIYCEKPISVTVAEGRQVAEVVRRHGRIFQTGTQYRSIPTIRKVVQFVRGGGLGRVKQVFTQLHTLGGWLRSARFAPYRETVSPEACGDSYGPLDFALPKEPVPEGLDWDFWVGPAPWRPYNRLYHVNPSPGVVPWSFDRAFGVTSSTWFLSHAADVIQYALGVEESGPVEIIHPAEGRYPTLTMRYANGTLLHFIHDWREVKTRYHAVPENARLAGMFGGVFVGERGWLTSMTNGGPIEGAPESLFAEMGLKRRDVNTGGNDHHANWLRCIHTRQRPYCDAELGHRTSCIGLLAHLCWELGRSLTWDPAAERFTNCEAANRLLSRATRSPWHL